MSNEDIDRLVSERSLTREEFDDDEVVGYWVKAVTSYGDAMVAGISSDGAFQLAYTAMLQATLAILAASGLRVKSTASHYKAFYAMEKLGVPSLKDLAPRFDALRAIRHASIYEPDEDAEESDRRRADALKLLTAALPTIREWLSVKRPEVSGNLASIR